MRKKTSKKLYKLFFWTFFGLFSLGHLQRIELTYVLPSTSAAVYVHELFMLFLILLQIPNLLKITPTFFLKKGYLTDKFKLTTAFVLWIITTTFISFVFKFDIISLLYVARLALYFCFASIVYLLLKQKKLDLKYFHFQLFSVGIFTLLLGLLQYLFIPDTRFLSIFGWDDHYARLIGSFFDPGFTGLILVISLFLGLSHSYLKKAQVPVFIAFVIGIALTFSRASYLSLFAAIFVLLVQRINSVKKLMTYISVILITFLILLVLIPKPLGEGVDLFRSASINARITAVSNQLSSVDTRTLLIGNGLFSKVEVPVQSDHPASYLLPSHSRIPDNLLLTIIIYSGVPGIIMLLLLVWKIFQIAYKRMPHFTAILIAFIVHAQFNNALFQPFTQLLLLLSTAVLFNLKNQTRK